MNQTVKSVPCVNCGGQNEGNFCQNCGQQLNVPRLTLKQFILDILDKVANLEGKLPRTIKDLTIRPGQVVRQYIKGNRVKYVNPIGYYFLLFGASLLLLSAFDINMVDMVDPTELQVSVQDSLGNQGSYQVSRTTSDIQKFIFNNVQIFVVLQFPFMALWALLFFRKTGYNFLEHLVLPFYSHGHLSLLNIISVPYFKLTGNTGMTFSLLVIGGYFAWAGILFYQSQNKIVGFLKMLGIYILSFACFFLLMGIIGLVIGFIVS